MPQDLFKRLCDEEVLRIAANYAFDDRKDDFIPDVLRDEDYLFNLKENLHRLSNSLGNNTYRPRCIKEIDVPKTGLAVRPGTSLDIEDHIVLFAIAYVLAPVMDRVLPPSVFHFRVKKKGKRPHPERLFDNRGPVLVRKVLRQRARIFEDWYEAWPEYVAEAQSLYEDEGYTTMVESDISAYFENISHPLLADILRQHAPQQLHLINLLMEIVAGWTTPSLMGFRPQRGIPQGNEVSSWLGTLYLVQMDQELLKLQRKGQLKYVRYVDDIKVFTKDKKTARDVVFMINRILRCLHLNMQTGKTHIYEGEEVHSKLYDERVEEVNSVLSALPPEPKEISGVERLRVARAGNELFRTHFRCGRDLEKEDIRLLKRTLTLLTRVRSPKAIGKCLECIWQQPALTQKICKYLRIWMRRTKVKTAVNDALFGQDRLFDTQYLYLFPLLRSTGGLVPSHKTGFLRIATDHSYHWAARAEAILSLLLFRLSPPDYERLIRLYSREASQTVKKTILAVLMKAPDSIKKPHFEATIYEPEEETNRFRKYLWALSHSPQRAQPVLSTLERIEADPARLLATLYGAVQSTHLDTLKRIVSIALNRSEDSLSLTVHEAYKDVAAKANAVISYLKRH